MIDRTELAKDLAALADERQELIGRHPSEDELAFFASGELPPEMRDWIEEHVATCGHGCSRRLLAAFEELDAFTADKPISGESAHLADQQVLLTQGRSLARELAQGKPSSLSPASWKRHLALAMAVVAGMVGGYLVAGLPNEPAPDATVLDAQSTSPPIVLGDVVTTLFPDESRVRSTEGNMSSIEAGAEDFVLLLRPPPGAQGFPGRLLEIEGPEGRLHSLEVHEGQVQEDYGLVLRISRHVLPSGAYRLTLSDTSGPVATYEVEIRTPASP